VECGPRWIWQRRRWHRARIRTPARTSGSGLPWRSRWPIRWPSRGPARRPTRKLTRWPNPCPTGVANGPGCRDRRQLYRVLTHRARFAISGAQAAGPPRRRNLPLRRPCRPLCGPHLPLRRPCRPLCGPHLPLRRRRRPPRRQRKRDGLTPPRLARRHRHRGHPFDEPAVHRQAHRPTNLAYAGHAAHPRQTVAWGLAYICRNRHLQRAVRRQRRHPERQLLNRQGPCSARPAARAAPPAPNPRPVSARQLLGVGRTSVETAACNGRSGVNAATSSANCSTARGGAATAPPAPNPRPVSARQLLGAWRTSRRNRQLLNGQAVQRQTRSPANSTSTGTTTGQRQTVAWGLAYICRNGHLRQDFRWHNLSRPACQLRRHFRRQVPIRRGEQPHPPGRSPDIQRLLTLPRHPPPMRVCGAFVRAFPFGVRGPMLRPPPIHRRPRATAAGARQRPATCRKVGVGIAARIDAVPTKRGATRTHLAAPHRVKMPNGRLRGDGAPAR